MCVHHAVPSRTHLYSLLVFCCEFWRTLKRFFGLHDNLLKLVRRRNTKVSGWTLSVAYLLESFTRNAAEISCIEWRLPDAGSDTIEWVAVALCAPGTAWQTRNKRVPEDRLRLWFGRGDIYFQEIWYTPLWIIIFTRQTLKRFESPNDSNANWILPNRFWSQNNDK